MVLAYTRTGAVDGAPQIIVWDTMTRRKISQIAVEDAEITCVQFSNFNNMILVVSWDGKGRSTIGVWDFKEGRRDFLSKSVVPFKIHDARWNPYIKQSGDEFVTISDSVYHYWRITEHLQL